MTLYYLPYCVTYYNKMQGEIQAPKHFFLYFLCKMLRILLGFGAMFLNI